MENNSPDTKESFSIHCWGMKIDTANPGRRTVLMLVLLLVFFLLLAWLLKGYVLPLLALTSSKSSLSLLVKKIFSKGG
jgi:hypothetical protein